MSKGDLIEVEGHVVDALGGGKYKIRTGEETHVIGQLSGRLKSNHIRVLPGDKVKIAVSPYDMSHGLITFRMK